MLTIVFTAATTGSTGLNVKGLVVVAIAFAILYPLQKRLRARVSQRRLERWSRDDPGLPARADEPGADEPGADEPGADGPPRRR